MADRYWLSPVPERCETCEQPMGDTMYDSAVGRGGPWACMCGNCFAFGPGLGELGTGRGQKYEKQPDGRWLKTGG